MHNTGKTIGELHALLIEYEKGLPKKAATPQVMAIQGGRIQKANKKSLNAKGKGKAKGKGNDKSYTPKPKNPKPYAKEHLAKDDACHHFKKVGHSIPSDGIYEIDMLNLLQNVNSIYNDSYFITFTDDYSRYDQGGEYISQEFKDYLKACGIVQQLTPPYTPRHNRVSERRNCTLLDMVGSMMNLITLSLFFWDYALETATRILNMVPTKKGCEALVKRDTSVKLQQRSVKCIFIGYPKEMMVYYFYFPLENKIVVMRHVEFLEKNIISQEVRGRAEELKKIQDKDTLPSENTSEIPMKVKGFEPPQEEVVPIRRSTRTHRAPDRLCLNVEVEEHSLGDLNEPANYKAAILDLESDNEWLFKKKTNMDGIVHTYKARLVAKGYTQTYEVDYEETFSPVVDIRDIYMVQPEGVVDPNHPRKVCKLQRSIYGLKQESRSWNIRFDEEIKRMDTPKHGYIPMQERLDLNKTQGASTSEENPGELHWTAVKTILKYLRNTKDMFLVYGENPKAELR
ncbi:retrotransposon protein, putative, ty1-copia subclass [Tanacetum coccineum]|uniref:Retrotransposon protein, putative, ty1-copia subclass n=1 Tax=Tanacetum coccineum TaxID=301880 RepID=A0ABQ5F722_9ASTR